MKQATLQFSTDFAVELCKGCTSGFVGRFAVERNGLPADAKAVRMRMGPNDTIEILIESEEFEDVESGGICPVLDTPWFRAISDAEPQE